MGTESPTTSQARASTPVKNMKRNASLMQESSDFSQGLSSPKRVKLIEAAWADGGFSDHSGPPITSPNALQPSPSGSQLFLVIMSLNRCHSGVKCEPCGRISSDANKVRLFA